MKHPKCNLRRTVSDIQGKSCKAAPTKMDWLSLPHGSIQLKKYKSESRIWISLNKVEWINNKLSEWWNIPVRGEKLAQMGQNAHAHTPQDVMRRLPFWIGTVHLWLGHKIPLRITSLDHKIPCDKGNIWQPGTSPLTPPPLHPPTLSPGLSGRLQRMASHPLWCEQNGGLTLLQPGWLTPIAEGITMLTL